MNRAAWLQDRRMQKFRDVLSRWEGGDLSMMEAGELLGMSERQFRRCKFLDRNGSETEFQEIIAETMQSQNARVWASRAFMDSSRIKGFTADPLPTGMDLGQMAELNETGERMSAEHFPKEIFANYPDRKEKKQADLVLAAGAVVVSAACADVLRQFDLGHSSLYPIKLFQHDRKTPVEGEYSCLNIGERKDVFLREHSKRVIEYGIGGFRMWPNLLDGEVAVDPAALDGPDLWVSPPLIRIFFLSDRLTQALRAAKMGRVFGFRSCRIVEAD